MVLLDYMCGIKGYRYELWCMARERATRCALLHCTVPRDTAEAWRQAALDAAQTDTTYTPHHHEVFDDLWQRFEVPDTRNRWDRPLIEVDPRDADATRAAVAAAVAALLGREHATQDVAVPSTTALKPTVATSRQLPTDTTRRTMIDRATQAVVQHVMDAQVRLLI